MSPHPRRTNPAHAFFAPLLGGYFEALRLSASVWWKAEHVGRWFLVHNMHFAVDAPAFERYFGKEIARGRYNLRSARRAERAGGPTFQTHNGLTDLWVPLRRHRSTFAYLVAGPFWLEPPEPQTLALGYERLSGKPPRHDDPTYTSYVRTMLETSVVDGEQRREMLAFGAGFADLVAGTGDARRTFTQLQRWTRDAEQRRPSFLMWDTARQLIDRFDNGALLTYHGRGSRLATLGVARVGTNVLAALPLRDRNDLDPVAAQVRGRRFQGDCVDLARSIPSSLVGRLGDDGVFMIVHTPARLNTQSQRAHLRGVAFRLRKLAERRALELPVGIAGRGDSPRELPDRYTDALLALEWAMHIRQPTVFFEDHADDLLARSRAGFYALVRDLRAAFEGGDLPTLDLELERFIKEVLRRSVGDVDAARGYFEAVTAELLGSLERRTIVDPRTVADLSQQFQAEAQGATFAHELSRIFEAGARSLARLAIHPAKADRAARLDRARAFVDRTFADPIRLSAVAKGAGLSPTHFSRAFKRHTGVGFERYVLDRRLDRARSLLRSTELPVYRVAAECGFSSYVHFARAFRRFCGTSARQFRQRDYTASP